MAKNKPKKLPSQRRQGSAAAITKTPGNIVTQPLNLEKEDDRIRAVFDLNGDDSLPRVSEETLQGYHSYLADHVTFPFEVSYSRETGVLHRRSYAITVMGLKGTEWIDNMHGLFAEARQDRRRIEVPLADIEVKEPSPNRQLIEDYSSWFVNHR